MNDVKTSLSSDVLRSRLYRDEDEHAHAIAAGLRAASAAREASRRVAHRIHGDHRYVSRKAWAAAGAAIAVRHDRDRAPRHVSSCTQRPYRTAARCGDGE